VGVIRWQDGTDRLRALNKELHRICIGERFEGNLLFSADIQRCSARGEYG